MAKSFILTINQGTNSTKTIIFDEMPSSGTWHRALRTIYMDGGYVEQDKWKA